MENEILQQVIERLIRQAEQAYQAQAGAASLCQLQKDGWITGDIKYEEGRLVALNNVHRALRADANQKTSAAGFFETMTVEQRAWLAALSAQQHKQPQAIEWLAYHQGGVDALAEVLAFMQAVFAEGGNL